MEKYFLFTARVRRKTLEWHAIDDVMLDLVVARKTSAIGTDAA